MKQRNTQGRYVTKHMTGLDRVIVMGIAVTTITAGAYIKFNSPSYAVASDLSSAGQPAVQSEIVSSQEASLSTMQNTAGEATPQPMPPATPIPVDEMSAYISEAVQEFLPTHKSEALMIMHCLAHRENGHAGNPNGYGDNGLAGGPYQFHQSTWERMRNQMIKQGVATEIGSRMDKKESTRTTAWAIANGRALEWGPIYRASKGSNYAACQKPSWYSK